MQNLLSAIQTVNDALLSIDELKRRIEQGMFIIVRQMSDKDVFDLPLLDHPELEVCYIELPVKHRLGIMIKPKKGALYLEYLCSQYNMYKIMGFSDTNARLLTMVNNPIKHWYFRDIQRILSSGRTTEGYLVMPERSSDKEHTHWKFRYSITDTLQHTERLVIQQLLNEMFE